MLGKPCGARTLGKTRHNDERNIKIIFIEIHYVNWTELSLRWGKVSSNQC
jgi:hypothetical protein